MTETIRELNAGELDLVSAGGAIGAIVAEAIKGLFAAVGAAAGGAIAAPTIVGEPIGAVLGGIYGVAAGQAVVSSLGLED